MITGTFQPFPADGACALQPVEHCSSRWKRWKNKMVQFFKGDEAALMKAAGNNDVTTIRRILLDNPSSVSPNFRHGKKNRSPALKAVTHGNVEALGVLLSFGASAKDVMTISRWESELPLPIHGGFIFYHYIDPVLYYTPQIIKTLLEDHDADPNTPYGFADLPGPQYSEVTSLERLNMTSLINWDPDRTASLSLQFARNPRTDLNCAINFNWVVFFPWVSSSNLRLPAFPTTSDLINLLGQAFLFKNTPLIDFLLNDDRVNPGLPSGSAENLIFIVNRNLMEGYHFNFLPALKAKLLSSREFFNALMLTDHVTTKRDFLNLFKLDPITRIYKYSRISSGPDMREVDSMIADLYPAFQSASGRATNH